MRLSKRFNPRIEKVDELMDDFFSSAVNQDQSTTSKTEAFIDCVQKAAKSIRFITLAENKCKEIRQVLPSDDKKQLWDILQKYIHIYADLINSTTGLTGLYVQHVDTEFYNTITIQEIKNQLRILIGFIYLHTIGHSAVKQLFKECLKKLLYSNNCFEKEDLAVLDMILG